MKKFAILMAFFVFAGFQLLQAQTVQISGTVTSSEDGLSVPGVSVVVKGTTIGTVTDFDGNYTIAAPANAQILVFSFVGFKTQEVAIDGRTAIDVVIDPDLLRIDEVVVTAFGITRERKALGYAVSSVGAEAVADRGQPDVARILQGKVTGVNIKQTSGLVGSGTNIIIRGYSSITGGNQPLFIVDGIPFASGTSSDANFVQGGATGSSRFLDLDPNNIAEVSILKGLAATVLYGESGKNGVILVTTKGGNAGKNARKDFQVSLSQSVTFSQVANLPDYQQTFGMGFNAGYGKFFSSWGPSFDARGEFGIAADGTVPHPLDNALYAEWLPEFQGARVPWQANNPIPDFFQTGVGYNTSLNFDKQVGNTSLSLNYGFSDDKGFLLGYGESVKQADGSYKYVPKDHPAYGSNSNAYNRHNIGVGTNTQLSDRVRIRTTVNITTSDRHNPPAAVGFGSNPSGASVFGNIMYTPVNIDLLNLPFQAPDGTAIYYRSGNDIQNPLWTINNAFETEKINRFSASGQFDFRILDWLSFNLRSSIDNYHQQNTQEINRNGTQVPDGRYRTSDRLFRSFDHFASLNYVYSITDDINIDGFVGFNSRYNRWDTNSTTVTNQFVFNLFNLGNFIDPPSVGSFQQERLTLGALGTATVSYKDYLFLGLQARNDWVSTLEEGNNAKFYPSASLSFIATEALGIQSEYLNFLRLRAGYGSSAGFPTPYRTRNLLASGTRSWLDGDGAAINTNSISTSLGNAGLKPELTTEYEVGFEGKFLDFRVGIDFSYYYKTSEDLIVTLRLDNATGFELTDVNGASMTNKGIELGLDFNPLRGIFDWKSRVNFTRARSIVDEILEGVDEIAIAGYTNLGNFAIVGQPYGVMQGTTYQRHANGQFLVSSAGEYITSSTTSFIGDPNPDFLLDWINTFSFKNFVLNFQIAYQHKGSIYSTTAATMLARGMTTDTDFDRFQPIILPGVKEDGTPNDVQIYAGDAFFEGYFGADEGSVFDATSIRLREISLSYALPKKLLSATPFDNLSLKVFANNVWYKAVNMPEGVRYDPELLSLGVGNGQGFEYLTGPTARLFGVALNVTF